MRKVVRSTRLLLVTLLFASCHRELKRLEYVQYIKNEENGLRKTVRVSNWEYEMTYKPHDYIALMENKRSADKVAFEKRKKSLNGTAWFNISFRLADGIIQPLRYNLRSREEYDIRLNYFLNGAGRDIQLVYGVDTLRPTSYLFETNYNLTPQETIVVGFDLPKGEAVPGKDMQLCFHDEVFKNGIIKAGYKAEHLKDLPGLIY